MSTPDSQHDSAPQQGAQQSAAPERRQLSTDTIVVLVVVGVLFLALIVGGVF